MNAEELPDIATIDQVADFLQISKPTLARWRASGDGPRFVRFGRTVRYKKNDLFAWVEAQ